MIEFGADQCFDMSIVRAVWRVDPIVTILELNDFGLSAAPDDAILNWAAENNLVLLTHDRRTMPKFAFARVAAGLKMRGVFIVPDEGPSREIIDNIILIAYESDDNEWDGHVNYLPL